MADVPRGRIPWDWPIAGRTSCWHRDVRLKRKKIQISFLHSRKKPFNPNTATQETNTEENG